MTQKPESLAKAEAEVAAQQQAEQDAKKADAEKEAEKARAAGAPPRTPDQIRADIEATRRELGATVDALSAHLDVKGRVQAWVRDPANRPQLVAAGVAVVSIVALVITKKVRS